MKTLRCGIIGARDARRPEIAAISAGNDISATARPLPFRSRGLMMQGFSDQTAVIRLLSDPSTYGGEAVQRIDTHASVVFLAGSRALKLKRAVKYDYLDFSTIDARRRFCDAELRINRRFAPTLYRRVLPIVRTSGGALALGGEGTPVDWVVEMTRFDQAALFDALATAGRLDLALMAPLAEEIAAFHDGCEPRPALGGEAGIRRVIEGNAEGLRAFGADTVASTAGEALTGSARLWLRRCGPLLESRRLSGSVRQCHGDLHLGNIVLLDGRPTLFDAIEFNDDLTCVDVMYDLAFLLMDLWQRGLKSHENAVLKA
jgi:aminoglycoside phosphotransferase family enzyme